MDCMKSFFSTPKLYNNCIAIASHSFLHYAMTYQIT